MNELIMAPSKARCASTSNDDITISKNKTAYGICIRNGISANFKSGYISMGVTHDRQRLYIMESDAKNGYKISHKHETDNGYVQMKWDELDNFIGNHTLMVGKEGYFIRRKVASKDE